MNPFPLLSPIASTTPTRYFQDPFHSPPLPPLSQVSDSASPPPPASQEVLVLGEQPVDRTPELLIGMRRVPTVPRIDSYASYLDRLGEE